MAADFGATTIIGTCVRASATDLLLATWPPMPAGTWAVLVEAEDGEECPEFGVATVIVYPPDADPEGLDVIPEAPFCFPPQDALGRVLRLPVKAMWEIAVG